MSGAVSFYRQEKCNRSAGILYGDQASLGLAGQIVKTLTPTVGLAFLVVQMTFIPCAATVAAMKQETGAWKWPAFCIGLLLVISFGVADAIYQLTQLMGGGG